MPLHAPQHAVHEFQAGRSVSVRIMCSFVLVQQVNLDLPGQPLARQGGALVEEPDERGEAVVGVGLPEHLTSVFVL